jgi:UPF0271 protein
MERALRLALVHGVRPGAHPSYPDRANFGRVEMALGAGEIERTVREQIGALEAGAGRLGLTLTHVKPHGALYNVAARNAVVAEAVGRAVREWRPGAEIYGLAGSLGLEVWRGLGLRAVAEGFADRRYEADGTLRSRALPGALISDAEAAAAQAVELARSGRVETLCVHGDSPGAVAILRACREALLARG